MINHGYDLDLMDMRDSLKQEGGLAIGFNFHPDRDRDRDRVKIF